MKRTRFYIGITLLIQAASFFIVFIMLCRKKKGLSKVVLAVALAGSITGAYLLCADPGGYPRRRRPVKAVPTEASLEDESLFEEEDSDEIEICDEDCEI